VHVGQISISTATRIALSLPLHAALSFRTTINGTVFEHNWCQMRLYGNSLAAGTASTLTILTTTVVTRCRFTAHAIDVPSTGGVTPQFSSFLPLIRISSNAMLADCSIEHVELWQQWVVWVEVLASIARCRFTNNTMSYRPLLRVSGDLAHLAVHNCTFANNTVSGVARGLIDLAGSATFVNCTWANNVQVDSAVHLIRIVQAASFSYCSWLDNRLLVALMTIEGSESVQIQYSRFERNYVERDASCFNISRSSANPVVSVGSSAFLNNSASIGSVLMLNRGVVHFYSMAAN
jgi:hypothetical protein